MQIWKFPLELMSKQVVPMPVGAKIIKAAVQHERVTLWAIVDPKDEVLGRGIVIVPTGGDFDDAGLTFIETVFAGPYVWHVFEQVW